MIQQNLLQIKIAPTNLTTKRKKLKCKSGNLDVVVGAAGGEETGYRVEI